MRLRQVKVFTDIQAAAVENCKTPVFFSKFSNSSSFRPLQSRRTVPLIKVNSLPAVEAVIPGKARLQGVLAHHAATTRLGSHLWAAVETRVHAHGSA
jgi:hypothetical protein